MFDISSLFDMLKQGNAASQPGPTDGSIPIPTANPNGPGLPAAMAAPPQVDPSTTASTTPAIGAGVLSGLGQTLGTNDGKGGASAFGGLLNFKSDDNKQAFLRGLLAASGSLMQAGGPSLTPHSLGSDVGGAIGAGTGAYDAYGQNKAQLTNAAAQTAKLNIGNATDTYKLAQAQKADAIRQALFAPNASTPSFNGGSSAGATNVPASASANPVGGILGTPAVPSTAPTQGMLAQASPAAAASAPTDLAKQINQTRSSYQQQYNALMQIGDGENARAIFNQMNLADNKAAEHGLTWNGASYVPAPGYTSGLNQEEYAKASGREAGEMDNKKTDDQLNLAAINADNVKNGKPAVTMQDYLDAKKPDGATGDMKNLVVINQQRVAAGQPPLSLQDYQESQKSNMVVTSDGHGGVTVTQGPGAKGASLSESQTASATFLARGKNALAAYDAANGDTALNSVTGYATNGVPILGPAVTRDDYQLANNSKSEIIRALLRKESGAVISPEEFKSTDQTYFPQPNDPPALVAQKKSLREEAISSLGYGLPDATLNKITSDLAAKSPKPGNNDPKTGNNVPTAPAVGTIMKGYKFLGGNPADRNSWAPAN